MTMKINFFDKDNNLIKQIPINSKQDITNKRGYKKSILDIALDNDIEIFYGCMGGSCGACKCKIEKGKNNINKEGIRKTVYKDIKEGEILTCLTTIDKFNEKENKEIEINIKKLF